jgi:hypothetical protein
MRRQKNLPAIQKSESADTKPLPTPIDFLVRLRRPDGTETLMRVPGEHFDRVMALAAGEFGDKSIVGIE